MKYARFVIAGGELPHDVQVTLLPSRRAFLRYLRSKQLTCSDVPGKPISGAGCAAKMLGFADADIANGDPFAEMVFYPDQFTTDSVAHEVSHVLILLFKRAGKSIVDNEELFAQLHGGLTQAVTDWKQEVSA